MFLTGSNHSVAYWGEDKIQIGCKSFSIEFWIENFAEVGKSQNYSNDQIAEYKTYIDIIANYHKTLNKCQ